MDHLSAFFEKYKIHLISWSIFILYEAVMVGLVTSRFGKFGNYAIHYSIHITAFYINAHFVLPQAFKYPKQANFRLPLYLLLMLIGYVIFVFAVDYLLVMYSDITETTQKELKGIWFGLVFRSSYFLGFSTGYYYLITYLKEKKRVNILESDKLLAVIEQERTKTELVKSQNAFLKAQINPHFLFNTLSFMHSQTQKVAPNVAESILCLSDMMRYSLKNESVADEVSLTDEIEQVENLINLHQLKAEIPLQIQLILKGDLSDIEILSMLLVTLAENMFKHGILSDPELPARFRIELCNADLLIATENLVNHDVQVISLNLGLQNITKRLEIKYKDQFSFSHHTDDQDYYHSRIVIKNIACLN